MFVSGEPCGAGREDGAMGDPGVVSFGPACSMADLVAAGASIPDTGRLQSPLPGGVYWCDSAVAARPHGPDLLEDEALLG